MLIILDCSLGNNLHAILKILYPILLTSRWGLYTIMAINVMLNIIWQLANEEKEGLSFTSRKIQFDKFLSFERKLVVKVIFHGAIKSPRWSYKKSPMSPFTVAKAMQRKSLWSYKNFNCMVIVTASLLRQYKGLLSLYGKMVYGRLYFLWVDIHRYFVFSV